MKQFYRVFFAATFVIGTALGVMACSPADGVDKEIPVSETVSDAVKPADIQEVTWKLVLLDQDSPVENSVITLVLGTDDRLHGKAGCNGYNGGYTIDGEELKVNPAIASTMMACAEDLMKQEYAYHQILGDIVAWSVNADHALELTAKSGKKLVFAQE